jgi:hypothetical protein
MWGSMTMRVWDVSFVAPGESNRRAKKGIIQRFIQRDGPYS